MRVPTKREQTRQLWRGNRILQAVVGDICLLHAAAIDEILNGLNAILELTRSVEQPEATAQHRLVVQLVRRRQPRRKIVLIRVVEVVYIAPKLLSSTTNGFALPSASFTTE